MTAVQTDPTIALPGTVYPMPPRPSWATNPELWDGEGIREHSHPIGEVASVEGDDTATVDVCRYDTLTDAGMVLGEAVVRVSAFTVGMSPETARTLAALLVQAADLLEVADQ